MQNTKLPCDTENTVVIQYNMTNDYMFRYILQKNEKVLRGLICAAHLTSYKAVRNTRRRFLSFTLDLQTLLCFRKILNSTPLTV